MSELPDSILKTRWLRMRHWRTDWLPAILGEANRVCRAPGWNPKVVNLDEETDMVDLAMWPTHDGGQFLTYPSEICVTKIEDHPFIEELPKNAPRSVKQIYRAEFRLRVLRSQDYFPVAAELDRAEAAWQKYLSNRNQ